jgi:uroporphyrin-III C-methyltransferase
MANKPTSRRHGSLVALGGKAAAATGGAVTGEVWLVGAGPGDPELLTLKALKVLQRADVVVHDGLVTDAILDLAPAGSRRLSVAKRKSRHSYAQAEINRLLVAFAREGLTVVRLKGGDPFIFGRGGEELEACRAAGVACHVVPGVTAALAAGAAAGAPLTHRGAAQAVTFVTGHAAAGEPDLDWPSLARPNQTVVVYMGVSTAPRIAEQLIAAGRAGSTPALIVEDASLPTERRLITTLAGLPSAAADVHGPALLIVGEAMALAQASLPTSLPLVGRDSEAQPRRVGESEAGAAPVKSPHIPTLTASRSVPPHEGEGRPTRSRNAS